MMLKSRLLGSGFACKLLLFSCLTILVHLSSQKTPYEASNWIEINKTNAVWPDKDPASKAPFLVFHSEYVNNRILGLKKEAYNDKWVTKPDLSFKYFSSSEAYFRSRKAPSARPERNVVLPSGSWKSILEKSITKDQWGNFGFENSDLFTLGLKDLSVKYVEKYSTETDSPDNITAFDNGIELVNFKLTSGGKTTTDDSDIKISFGGKSAKFDKDLKSWNLKEIKFHLKHQSIDSQITITANVNTCKINPDNKKNIFATSKCTNGIIEALEINVDPGTFEITNFQGTYTNNTKILKGLKELRKTLNVRTPADEPTKTTVTKSPQYTIIKVDSYEQVKGIVRLNGTKPTGDNDVCYTITKTDTKLSGLPEASFVDVYLTLDKTPVGFKLDTVDNAQSKVICVFDYIALQNIDNYIVTLVAQGDVSDQFSISYEVKSDSKKSKKELVAPDNDATNNKLDLNNPKWFFYNSIFDNIVRSDAKEIYACDVISSCYPLEKIEDTDNYKIPDILKNEMAKSPFFQIRAIPSTSVVKFATSTTDQSKKEFNKKFMADNKQYLTSNTIKNAEKLELKYYLQFTDNLAKVSVSLDSIDMRFQELIMGVQLVNGETDKPFDNKLDKISKLFLNSITLQKNGESEYTYPEDNTEAQISLEKFQGSTKEYFFVRPTKVTTGNNIKLIFQLNANPDTTKQTPFVKLQFQIQTLTQKETKEPNSVNKVPDHLFVIHEKTLVKTADSISFKIKPNQTRYIYSNFIENADNTTKMSDLKLNIKLTVKGVDHKTFRENYDFYRVILDSGTPKNKHKQVKTLSADSGNSTVTITDGVDPKTDSEIVKGPFRVVYIIRSQDTAENTIVINSFNVEVVPNTNTKKTIQSLANVDQTYENAVCVYGNEIKENVCTLKEFHRLSEEYCNLKTGCDNILDQKLPTSSLEQDDKKFVPFQTEDPKIHKKLNRLSIFRPQPLDPSKADFCVDFAYAAKSTLLTVATDVEELKTLSFPVTNEGSEVSTTICASHFTNLVTNINTINFSFAAAVSDIDHHYIKFNNGFSVNKIDNSELDGGIYRNNLDTNQFLEHPHCKLSKTKYTNSLIYTINAAVVKVVKPNTQDSGTPLYYETIRSKWIKVPTEDAKFKIGLNYTSEDKDGILHTAKTYVISSLGDRKKYNFEDFKSDSLVIQSDAKYEEYYRFEIEVSFNYTKAQDLGDKLNPFVMTIKNLTINDPCVNDDNKVETCSSDEAKKIFNECHRGYNETVGFKAMCQCTDGFKGETCNLRNYCHFAPKTCTNCKNDYVFENVICDCTKGKTWNPFIKDCINPNELICEANMRPQYNRVTKKSNCVCLEDYVAVPLNASTAVTSCVPFEPCKLEHRKLAKVTPLVPCSMKNATCEMTGSKKQPSDFQCKCDKGFYNEHDVLSISAVCLPDKCKSCPAGQYCKPAGNDYKCTENTCDVGYNKTLKSCEFDGKLFAKNFGCNSEAAELKEGKPVCKCAAGQRLNEKTKKCDPDCDDAANSACLARGAPKCSWDKANAKPMCECKNTDIAYAVTDQKEASDWQCISKCSLLAKPEFSGARCTNSFEHCDESYATADNPPLISLHPKDKVVRVTVDATKAPYIKGVFVKGVTTIDMQNITKRDGQNEYCACDVGFTWNKGAGRCFPSTLPTHTITGFEFDLIHTSNEHDYIEKVRQAFINLIAFIVHVPKEDLNSPTKCDKASDTTILCRTSFQSALNDTQIADKLKAACVEVDKEKSKCYYVVDPQKVTQYFASIERFPFEIVTLEDVITFGGSLSSSPSTPDVLIHVKGDPQVHTQNYCDNKNICAKYAYSECVFDEKKNKPFECLCPHSQYLNISDIDYIYMKDKNKNEIDIHLQTCNPVNLCITDPKNHGCHPKAQCHSQVELNKTTNTYEGITYCTCSNGIILSDRSLSCESTCNGWCSKNTASCVQDYLNTKKIACTCKDGFTGEKCEKSAPSAKKDAEASSSKAYLISTIVVSVIAAIALIGLAVLYFKRR